MDDFGFMGPPIGYGEMLLAPVSIAGSIYIYALDASHQGEVLWRSYLTDEPAGTAVAWSSIHLTVEGSDLYVVCGCGVLFVLDPNSGLVRFARRYPRTGKLDEALRNPTRSRSRISIVSWRMSPSRMAKRFWSWHPI